MEEEVPCWVLCTQCVEDMVLPQSDLNGKCKTSHANMH